MIRAATVTSNAHGVDRLNIKPYHVFSVEGHDYLVKLLSNRVYPIAQDEEHALRLYLEEGELLDESLAQKYGLIGGEADYETGRRHRWNRIFAERKPYCMELMMAQECNLRCAYCYGDGQFGGRGIMSDETVLGALDWFLASAEGKKYPPGSELSVSFFGGEPLLNYPMIKRAIEYLHDERGRKDISFSITTNLTLLTDEMLAFFKSRRVSLLISFDGRMQRLYRRYASGADSYETVSQNIRKALSVLPASCGRGTLYGEGDMEQMTDDLLQIGFRYGYINGASGSLISGTVLKDKQDWYRVLVATYPEKTRRYLNAIKERDEEAYRRLSFDQEFMNAVGRGWNPSRHMMSCGGGRTMVAVDVKGDIYPCHRFVGVKEMRMGSICTPFDQLHTGEFADHVSFHQERCRDCFLRFTCGGSCMHESYCDVGMPDEAPTIHRTFDTFCQYRRLCAELAIHTERMLNAQDRAWLRGIRAKPGASGEKA